MLFRSSGVHSVENKENLNKVDSETKDGDREGTKKTDIQFPDDAFLMVTQTHWEDDIIWNGDEIKNKVQKT